MDLHPDEYGEIDAGSFLLLPAVDLALWLRIAMVTLLLGLALGVGLTLA